MQVQYSVSRLGEQLQSAAEQYSDRLAIWISGGGVTYGELHRAARTLAEMLSKRARGESLRVALFAEPGLTACVSILAVLIGGGAVIPLNPKFPLARNRHMLSVSKANLLLVESDKSAAAAVLLRGVENQLSLVVVRHRSGHASIEITATDEAHNATLKPPKKYSYRPSDAPSYVLFTSGSTGQPKCVEVSEANLLSYLGNIRREVPLFPSDRVSHLFELTFDLSIHDLLLAWLSGACVCIPSASDRRSPLRYIQGAQLTAFFCVPSLAAAVGAGLTPNCLQNLRISLFCGEPLPNRLAELWSGAAQNSEIVNLYGPTETTIAISAFWWRRHARERCSSRGIVYIGRIFPDHEYAIVAPDLRRCREGEQGELLISGPQVTSGYLSPESASASAFIELPYSEGKRWYRTGDIARDLGDRILEFYGRYDEQVKIAGHRIELGEVEYHLRDLTGSELAAAVIARAPSGRDHIIAFVESKPHIDCQSILNALRDRLPGYMVPSEVRSLTAFPTNASGKLDKAQMRLILEISS